MARPLNEYTPLAFVLTVAASVSVASGVPTVPPSSRKSFTALVALANTPSPPDTAASAFTSL